MTCATTYPFPSISHNKAMQSLRCNQLAQKRRKTGECISSSSNHMPCSSNIPGFSSFKSITEHNNELTTYGWGRQWSKVAQIFLMWAQYTQYDACFAKTVYMSTPDHLTLCRGLALHLRESSIIPVAGQARYILWAPYMKKAAANEHDFSNTGFLYPVAPWVEMF